MERVDCVVLDMVSGGGCIDRTSAVGTTLSCLFANSRLRTADEVVRVSANAVGQWKILSVRLFTWTTTDFLVVNAVVLVFDSHLA